MDPASRSIILSLVAVLGFTALAVLAALVVPFDVNQDTALFSVTGTAELLAPGKPARLLDPASASERVLLQPGETLRLSPGSSAALLFFNDGQAVLTGPATLKLVTATRRATLLGHNLTSDRFPRSYTLTLQQTQGTVRYLFNQADPPFEDITLAVQLPGSRYIPQTPCWIVDIDASGYVTTEAINCP